MAGKGKTQQRLLREMRYLQEYTSPHQAVDIPELIAYLDELSATRQIIYQDFHEMERMGAGIHHERNGHYYYDRQSFSEGELSLMIDLICCAGYPDIHSAEQLILHIKQLGNMKQFDILSEQTNLALRNKSDNPNCIINTEMIHHAIREQKKIRFRYEHINAQGIAELDAERELSPYCLIWNNSRLYLVGGYEQAQQTFQLRNYRVDKIYEMQMTDLPLTPLPAENCFYHPIQCGFDAERYLKATFDMFNAEDGMTTLTTFCIANTLLGVAYDTFGKDIVLTPLDDAHMQFTAEIQVSNMFFGWLARFHYDQMHILQPPSLCRQYQNYLRQIAQQYDEI